MAKLKSFHEGLDFTRASTKWVFDKDGVLVEVPVDEPAFDHDPATGESLGVLIEESRTNLLTWSEELSDSSWGKSGVTVSTDSDTAPDLSTTVDKIVESSANEQHQVKKALSLSVDDYLLSFFFKAGERGKIGVVITSDPTILLEFDSVTETFPQDTTGSARFQKIAGGFYKIEVPVAQGVASSAEFRFHVLEAVTGDIGVDRTYLGDGTSGLYIWGAQLEQASTASSYIPTTSAAATRAADNLSRTLGDEFSTGELTVYLDITEKDYSDIMGIYGPDNTNTGVRLERAQNTGRVTLYIEENGGFDAITAQTNDSSRPLERRKIAFSIISDGGIVRYAVDGAPATETASSKVGPALSFVTRMFLGKGRPSSGIDNTDFKYVAVYPHSKTAAELEALTS